MKVFLVLFTVLAACPASLSRGLTVEDEAVDAIRRKDAASLRRLIPELGDADWITIDGRKQSLLLVLARTGLCDLLPLLVEQGARTSLRETGSETVLEVALPMCIDGMTEFKPEFLAFFVDQGRTPTDILRHAAGNAAGMAASPSPMGKAIFAAKGPVMYQAAAWAIEQGADVDVESAGARIIYWLSKSGVTELVRLLLEKGADPDASRTDPSNVTTTALEVAGNLEVKKLLEEAGARR